MRTNAHYYYYVHSQSYASGRHWNTNTSRSRILNKCVLRQLHTTTHTLVPLPCVFTQFSYVSDWTEWIAVHVDNLSVFLTVPTVKDKLNQINLTTQREEWPTQSCYEYMLHSIKNVDFVTDSKVFMSRENCNLLFSVGRRCIGVCVRASVHSARLHLRFDCAKCASMQTNEIGMRAVLIK